MIIQVKDYFEQNPSALSSREEWWKGWIKEIPPAQPDLTWNARVFPLREISSKWYLIEGGDQRGVRCGLSVYSAYMTGEQLPLLPSKSLAFFSQWFIIKWIFELLLPDGWFVHPLNHLCRSNDLCYRDLEGHPKAKVPPALGRRRFFTTAGRILLYNSTTKIALCMVPNYTLQNSFQYRRTSSVELRVMPLLFRRGPRNVSNCETFSIQWNWWTDFVSL